MIEIQNNFLSKKDYTIFKLQIKGNLFLLNVHSKTVGSVNISILLFLLNPFVFMHLIEMTSKITTKTYWFSSRLKMMPYFI